MRVHPFLARVSFTSALLAAAAAAQSVPAAKAAASAVAGARGAISPPSSALLVVGGSDDCANAAAIDPIAGAGTFAVTTFGATTGGQQGAGCVAVRNDVWFHWTSPVSATTTIALCGGAAADTVLAVWPDGAPSGTCPTGPVVACNDDFCGLQSTVIFPANAGASYFVQIGSYSEGNTYSGTFTITSSGPAIGDECASPVALPATGTYAYDNGAGTTSAQGQTEALCLFFGTTAVTRDLWYTWTAPADGTAVLATCGGTSVDSKIAAYTGSGCPTGPALACNDDVCALQSRIAFAVTAGQSYTFQLGCYPGAAGGAGTFQLDLVAPSSGCLLDDGSAENTVGLTLGGDFVVLQRFDGVGTSVVASVSAAFGAPAFPIPSHDGLPFRVAVWDDPDDDGVPDDLVLVTTANGVVANEATNTLVEVPLAVPVSVAGVYFVGVAIVHATAQFPCALDQSQPAAGRSWFAGQTGGGAADLANLSAASVPPAMTETAGIPGIWLLRADCSASTGTPMCAGTFASCPCGNGGAPDHGCGNTSNLGGAALRASGTAVIGADSVLLLATGMTSGAGSPVCTFAQSANLTAPAAFGDGVSCLGGPMVRLRTRATTAGSAAFGAGVPGDPPVSVAGLVTFASTQHYQVVYRNAAPFCTSATFNVTSGVTIVWN